MWLLTPLQRSPSFFIVTGTTTGVGRSDGLVGGANDVWTLAVGGSDSVVAWADEASTSVSEGTDGVVGGAGNVLTSGVGLFVGVVDRPGVVMNRASLLLSVDVVGCAVGGAA